MQPSPPPAIYSTPAPSPDFTRHEIDGYVEYDSEFADVIVDASGRYDLIPRGTVLPYAKLIVSYDSQPTEPGLSEVYNEDAVIAGVGLRLPLGTDRYGEIFAQGGYSFGLQSQRNFPETRWGFDYSRDYGASYASAFPHTQFDAELIDYSRFAGNVIGAVYAYHDARISSWLRGMLGTDLSFDSHREYGNNYVEAFAGFMIPFSPELDLQFTGVEGTYLSRAIGVPSPPWYSTFRITLSHASPP